MPHNFSYTQEQWERLYEQICNGNKDAYLFLCAWNKFCHGLDDIVDEDIKTPEEVCEVFFQCTAIYSSVFWLNHQVQLYAVVALITSDYVDSNNPLVKEADILRFSGNYMLLAVALICGGYQHMRKFSVLLRDIANKEHHNDKGESI